MQELLNLLKDGKSRSIEMLAQELGTTTDDILRKIEFLEQTGMLRRVSISNGTSICSSCSACPASGNCPSGHNKKMCAGCMPKGGFKHMGEMWEVVK